MIRHLILIFTAIASLLYLEIDLQYIAPMSEQFLPELPLICEPSPYELSGVTCPNGGECIWVDDSGMIFGCPQAQPPPAKDLEGITHWDDWLYLLVEPTCTIEKYPIGDCTAPIASWELIELQTCNPNQRCEAITAVGLDHVLVGHQGENAIYDIWLYGEGAYSFIALNSTLDHWPVFRDLSGSGAISGLYYDYVTGNVWASMGDAGSNGMLVEYEWQGQGDFIWEASWALLGKQGVEGVAQKAGSWSIAIDNQSSGERCLGNMD